MAHGENERQNGVPMSFLGCTFLFTVVVTLALCLPLVFALKVPGQDGYDADFFEQHRQNAEVYPALVKAILTSLLDEGRTRTGYAMTDKVNSVVDVGCGHGLLVEAFRTAGLESYGIEGSSSAEHMWPADKVASYYQIQDLTEEDDAKSKMPPTDLVTTFEVAEHLPPQSASAFVRILAAHRPRHIVFGAATVGQDGGRNPTHLNENSFRFWIDLFDEVQYVPDLVATASVRHKLITDPQANVKIAQSAWWYPKNVFVFVDNTTSISEEKERDNSVQNRLDKKLLSHPKEANMLKDFYLNLFGPGAFGELWKRDWLEFGTIFYEEQEKARAREQGAKRDEL